MSRPDPPIDTSLAPALEPKDPGRAVRVLRTTAATAAAPLVFFGINALDVWWLRGSQFSSNAFYDGWAACLTLALPAFLAGLALGFLCASQRVTLAIYVFLILMLANVSHPRWQIPLVSPQSAHSGAMHYFLHSPPCLLAFGLLGAWLAEQFALGRFRLADDTPVTPAQMGDD